MAGSHHDGSPDDAAVLISLTRLRLASPRFLPAFLLVSLHSIRQARASPGFLSLRLLADRRLTFWTATAFADAASMKAFRAAGAHREAMRRLPHWCDEASVTRWFGPVESMQDWRAAHARMAAQGELTKVRRPSRQHAERAWPMPRLRPRLEAVIGARR
jgi:hypothetical protein